MAGDAARAGAALDSAERDLGLSLWLVARRIALLRLQGVVPVSDYVNQLIAEGGDGTIGKWLVYMMGYRADPNVSPVAYIRRIESVMEDDGLPSPTRAHIRYHAMTLPPRGVDMCSALLAYSENLPLVDRYVTMLDVLQSLTCEQSDASTRAHVFALTQRLNSVINDDRLILIGQVLDSSCSDGLIARVDPAAADLYTCGEYEKAIEKISEELNQAPSLTNLYTLAARAMSRTELAPNLQPSVLSLIRDMASVQIFAEDDATTSATLLREALIGSHRTLAASIRTLFASRSANQGENNLEIAYEALNSKKLTPLQLRNLPTDDPTSVLAAAVTRHPSSLSLKLQRAVLEFGKEELPVEIRTLLPVDRGAIYSARAFSKLGRHRDAINELLPFVTHAVHAVANDACRELFVAYQSAGFQREALRLVARAYCANPKLHALFKVGPLLDEIEATNSCPPFDEIALSIVYHIVNRFGGDTRAGAEADSAEEFAISKGANLPSQISFVDHDLDGDLVNVYLDQVCSTSVLDKFMAIESVSQVEVERLEICRILSERDAAGRQRYLDEIREITGRRVVRERFAQVERTKIYVDTDGVKRQAEKTLRDTYMRFLVALDNGGQASARLEMMRKVQSILSEIEADGLRVHFADLPASERELMFDQLVGDFMRMLISSQEYGLEAYLSTRVRHGTMGNQLRSAFEVNSLMTQKENGVYQPDLFWQDTLDLEDDPLSVWLATRLARFSQDIDDAIEDLVKSRVQVRSDRCPNGLFIFTSYNYDIIKLQSEITAETTFDVFLDKVIEQFWGILEQSLSGVRAFIEGEFFSKVRSIVDALERDVVSELRAVNSSSLRSAIAAARTQMSVTVANVANWFTLARDMERPDFEFGVAVEVATESIRVCHPSLDLGLERRDNVTFDCRGRTLESLVYLLFTALDNAVAHCGFVDSAPTMVLDTKLANGWLEITLTNSCVPVKEYQRRNDDLADLRRRIETDVNREGLASKEGGSGYPKIIRILRHELQTKYVLEFGYISPEKYEVKIGMEAKVIIK